MPELGRIPSPPDPRDAQFSVRRIIATQPLEALPRYKYWGRGPVLDQDGIGACVGFAHAQWLQSLPVRTLKLTTDSDSAVPNSSHTFAAGETVAGSRMGFYVYAECKETDGWAGEGTYVREAMTVLRRLGRIDTYVWATNMEDLLNWLLLKGPVIVGTDWSRAMFDPDERGYLDPSGAIVGGHAYLLIGANRTYRNPDKSVGRVRVLNSWGRGFGLNGCAWLTFPAIEDLVFRRPFGEAVTATERSGA